ncbi:MAG: Phenolic acid decarboxylase subunit C [Pelotomaculum sp. PtaU1.Bin065]|nr:MAG: Phenolic acid decarboxylase subunit C [Pelotomaculum sp. PtaU1.Bin065]
MRSTNYKDLREWMELVKEQGELSVVKGATWQEDIGMATEMLNHSSGSPAALFEDIPGIEPGFRVLTNALRSETRLALTFGLPLGLSKIELADMLYKKLKNFEPIPPVEVKNAPILENVMEGKDIDVLRFPTPIWHEADGGRYIGTASYDITCDPDDPSITNLGTYRVMVSDKNHVFFYVSPGKHGRIHRDKWFARNEPCPFVVVVGGDPLLYLAGCNEVPINEYEWAGGVRGEAFEIIKGKYTGLPIPARAEIAIEGFCYQDDKAEEGPFGEWTGYYASTHRPESRVEIKAIYHRNDPILLGSPPNCPPDELAFYRAFMRSPLLKEEIGKAGVPDVVAAWCHEAGGSRMFNAISVKQRYPGHATQVGHIASQCHVGAYCGRYTVVVDDDIDVSNLEEVIWAMSSRSDPASSIDIIKRCWSTHLDPRISPDDKKAGALWNNVAVIDACRPYEWRDQFPRVNKPSFEVKKKTIEKFGYLLKK